jgi:hypothetical protein
MLFAFLAAMALYVAGCSGINTGASVSPASFFLPGLLKNDAPCVTNSLALFPETSKEFASNK